MINEHVSSVEGVISTYIFFVLDEKLGDPNTNT